MKKSIILSSLTFAGLLGLSNGAVLYEDFDYATGSITTATGWGGNGTIATPGLTYGSLASAGNTAQISGQSASSSTGSLLSGLLDDGDTLWFSVLANFGTIGTNPDFGFALGTGVVGTKNNIPMSSSGDGLGFRVKGNNGGLIAASWSGGAVANGTTQSISAATTYLIVGEMIFNSDNTLADTINLYLPGTDLTLGSVVVTRDAVLNQTLFNTISFGGKSGTTDQVDEIRFGTSYASVSPIPEPSATLLGGLGALLLLRRRRR